MDENDLRWQRTENRIKLGFIKELDKRPYSQLTITALVKTTRISRRAFYLHYQDKADLLHRLEDKLLQQLRAAFTEDHRRFLHALDNQEVLWQQNYLFFTSVFTTINNERQLFRVLMSNNGDPLFTQQMWRLVSAEIDTRAILYNAHLTAKIPSRYAKVLIVDALIGLVQSWLNNPHPESVAHFSRIVTASQFIAPFNLLEKN